MTAVLALFGAGRIGAIHAANIARDPTAVLKYVVDVDPQAAARLADAFGAGFRSEPALPFSLERYREAYRLEIGAFVAALQGRPNDLADGADALRALVLADAAERSAASGEWADVPG